MNMYGELIMEAAGHKVISLFSFAELLMDPKT